MINQTIMFVFFMAMFAILISGLICAIRNLVRACRAERNEQAKTGRKDRDSVDYDAMIHIADVGKMVEICKEA